MSKKQKVYADESEPSIDESPSAHRRYNPFPYNPYHSEDEDHNGRELNNPFEDPMHPSRWKHRRRMAYSALISVFVVTAYLLVWADNDRIEALDSIIEWFYFTQASIVGAYMGFASWAATRGR